MAIVTGQLAANSAVWTIPAYAQKMLWLTGADAPVQTSGPQGTFELTVSDVGDGVIDLAWGVAHGPLLARWPVTLADAPITFEWRGTVGIGGFIERLHAFETRSLELVVAEIVGALLPPRYPRLPTLEQMRRGVFQRDDISQSPDVPEFTYPVIALADSISADFLHHAMVSELAVDCLAVLGAQDGRWHDIVGLPLLVESLSLLSPG